MGIRKHPAQNSDGDDAQRKHNHGEHAVAQNKIAQASHAIQQRRQRLFQEHAVDDQLQRPGRQKLSQRVAQDAKHAQRNFASAKP